MAAMGGWSGVMNIQKTRKNTKKSNISFFVVFDIFWILYGLPEAPEVSRNLPGGRGIIFPKYEPIPSHGDPIHPQNYQISSNSHLPDHNFSKLYFNFWFSGGTLRGLDPSQKMHIDCPHLQKRGYGGCSSHLRSILLGFCRFQEGIFCVYFLETRLFMEEAS